MALLRWQELSPCHAYMMMESIHVGIYHAQQGEWQVSCGLHLHLCYSVVQMHVHYVTLKTNIVDCGLKKDEIAFGNI